MLRKLLHIFLTIIGWLSCYKLPAQDFIPKFEKITVEDGLPSEQTSAILHDSKGFMWFGGTQGLTRYDGYTYKAYVHDPADSTSLPGNYVECLYEDSKGNIWIGLLDKVGLCRYDPVTDGFIAYRNDPNDSTSIGLSNVSSICETSDGYLWFGRDGVDRLDPKTGKFKRFRMIEGDSASLYHDTPIFNMYEDAQKNFWIGAGFPGDVTRGALNLYHPETETFTHFRHNPDDPSSLRYNAIMEIFEDSRGNFWVGTVLDGLHLMDRDKGTFQHFPYDPQAPKQLSGPHDSFYSSLNFIKEDFAGRLWLGGFGGLVIYNSKNEEVIRFQADGEAPSSLSSNYIWKMAFDRFGNAWFGSGEPYSMLNKLSLKPAIFHQYMEDENDPHSISGKMIREMVKDFDGQIWFGTEKGLNRLNPQTKKVTFFKTISGIIGIALDSIGNIWCGGSFGELYTYNSRTEQLIQLSYSPPNLGGQELHNVSSIIYNQSDHTLWIAHHYSGRSLVKYDIDQKSIKQYLYNDEPIAIASMFKDQDERLWLVSWGALFLLDEETDHLELKFAWENRASILYEDRSGNFWIGTKDSGLWLYDRETGEIEVFDAKHGLDGQSIYQIAEDEKGNLWLGTSKRISKFDPVSKTFVNYDANDGVMNRFTISSNSFVYGENGEIYLGGQNGITEIFTRQQSYIPVPPEIMITQVQTKEENISLLYQDTEELAFDHDENNLTIEFVGIHLANPSQNRYRYKLDGFDKEWILAGTDRKARYTNLDPDSYIFRVKAISSEGVESVEASTLKIIIHPPWWATIWAYIAYILIGLSVLYAIRWSELKKQEKRLEAERKKLDQERKVNEQLRRVDALKDQFLANTSHELRTPLNGIIGLSESLAERVEKNDQKEDLDMIVCLFRKASFFSC